MKDKKILVLFFIFFTGCFLISNEALAAWTQAKGHSYNQLSYSYYVSQNKYSTSTQGGGGAVYRVPSSKFTSTDVSFYTEYGVVDTVTIFTSFAYKQPKSDDTLKYSGEKGPSGIGDVDFGLRYNIVPNLFTVFGGKGLFSLQGTVTTPEFYDFGFPLSHLSNGDGHYSSKLELLSGWALGKGYLLCNLGYKYMWENNNIDIWDTNNPTLDRSQPYDYRYSDQVKFFLGGGYAVHPKVEVRGSLEYTKSIGNSYVSENLLNAYRTDYGGQAEATEKGIEPRNLLIKDTLGLEPEVITLGVGLAITTSPQTQLVLSLNQDVGGFETFFRTRNAGEGTTYGAAFVYMH
ncbi:MAG: hypothetical protein HY807_02560 [Nitrospirae bacterium]|nr:hypothetical protein [Nitrospirota bacterium]